MFFIYFRKCYGILGSELILSRFQPLKIQDFGFFVVVDTAVFFDISNPQYLPSGNSKPY